MNLRQQNKFNQDLIADAQKHFQAIIRRGRIKDKKIIAKLAIQFVESDRFIAAIAIRMRDESPEIQAEWAMLYETHYADRDAGSHDRADLGKREMKNALLPMLEKQFKKNMLEKQAEMESVISESEKARISREIGELKSDWAGIRRNLKS